MIRRTPQEIADFFGCYVARDKGRRCFTIYTDKPERNDEQEWWSNPSGEYGELPFGVVDVIFREEDWTKLYEPNPDNKSNDSKPDHLGEVYIHKEYVLLGEFDPNLLMQKINEYLNKGYKLYGNPWTGPNTNCGYIHYQAMVRGV